MLALAQRPRWLQSDSVTDVAMILLVVGHEFGGPLHVSVVEFVMEQPATSTATDFCILLEITIPATAFISLQIFFFISFIL